MKKKKLLIVLFFIGVFISCKNWMTFKPETIVKISYTNDSEAKTDTLKIKEVLDSRLLQDDYNYRYQFDNKGIVSILFDKKINVINLKKRLETNSNIEFWHTHKNIEVGNLIYEIANNTLSNQLYPNFLDSLNTLTLNEDSLIVDENYQKEIFKKSSPLSAYLYPNANELNQWMEGSILGYAKISDTALINDYLSNQYFLDSLPFKNIKFMWEYNSTLTSQENIPLLSLFLVKNSKSGKPELDGKEVESVKQDFDPISNYPIISLQFSKIGTLILGDITESSSKDESGIAITIDNKVFSAPIATGKIEGGKIQISGGSFMGEKGLQEAKNVTAILNSKPSSYKFKIIDVQEFNNAK